MRSNSVFKPSGSCWQQWCSRDAIELWIDVGIPDEKLIRKACGRSSKVVVYCHGARVADMWFAQNGAQFERQKNLTIINLPVESTKALAKLA